MTDRSWLTPSPDCLTTAQLERLADGHGDAQAQAHLDGCPICKSEFALMREFHEAAPQAGEIAAVRAITAQLEKRPWQSTKASWWERWGVRSWAPMAAAAMAAMLVVAVWVGRPDRPAVTSDPDVVRSGAVTLLAPVGELAAWPGQFTWSPVAGAARYTVRLLEVDGTVLWTGDSPTNAINVPASVVRAGRAFDWTVAAYDASGQRISESSRERIRLGPAKP